MVCIRDYAGLGSGAEPQINYAGQTTKMDLGKITVAEAQLLLSTLYEPHMNFAVMAIGQSGQVAGI